MSERDDDDQQHVVGHGVEDAIVPYPDPKAGPTPQRAGAWRAWVMGQERDGTLNAVSVLGVKFA